MSSEQTGPWEPAPYTLPPPGETIREWLVEHHRTQIWLAEQVGCSTGHLNQIVMGHSAYSTGLADRIADVTGMPARVLMNLQSNWQLNHNMAGR